MEPPSAQRDPVQRHWIELGLLAGLVLHYVLFFLGAQSLIEAHVWASLTALAVVNRFDLRLRDLLGSSEDPISLDGQGCRSLNRDFGLSYTLLDERHHPCEVISFGEVSQAQLDAVDEVLRAPLKYEKYLSTSLTSLDRFSMSTFEERAEVRTLPYLPSISGRPQLGIFSKQAIPAGTAFLWRSDLGICPASSTLPRQKLFDEVTLFNRRALLSIDGVEVFQGAGPRQASNPGTLINFSWCHTESTPAETSPYRLLPPHDLGPPNCYFCTVIASEIHSDKSTVLAEQAVSGQLCSAIVTYREIPAGQQLLAFTGHGASLRSVMIRRLISRTLELLSPALLILPWLRLCLNT